MMDPKQPNDFHNSWAGVFARYTAMFPDYLFIDGSFRILLAGNRVEELLYYSRGSLSGKNIDSLGGTDHLRSSIMIQVLHGSSEWRTYDLTAQNGQQVQVEICGFRMNAGMNEESTIVLRIRNCRHNLDLTSPELNRLSYWIANNLAVPLGAIQDLIESTKNDLDQKNIDSNVAEILKHSRYLEHKIKLMMTLADRLAR